MNMERQRIKHLVVERTDWLGAACEDFRGVLLEVDDQAIVLVTAAFGRPDEN
jgi:hypothetical protein